MNINKFTQKSAEALNNCEKLAYEYGNQEVDQEHLLYSLLTIEDSLIAKLVEKMEIHLPSFIERAKKALEQKKQEEEKHQAEQQRNRPGYRVTFSL